MTTKTGDRSKGSKSHLNDETGDSQSEASGVTKTTQGEAMAEETQTARPAKKSRKKGHSSKKKAASRAAVKKRPATYATEALATEQPVPSTPVKKTSQYVVTVDNQTGLPVKIEKLDSATGARKELSSEEYGQALAFGGLSSAETDNLVRAYYQGVTDYINALTPDK